MTRELRTLPRPGALIEVTQQTIQRRFLLRPSKRANALIVGCLARAQKNTGAVVHAVAVLSNHFHLLASFETAEQMATFMKQFKGNLSKELGRLHRWPGSMFSRRYHSAAVSDEPGAQIARLRYVLSQGAKEGLVLSPRDWPGVHSADALVRGRPLSGLWVDRTELWARRNRGEAVTERDVTSREVLHLEPLPCWAERSQRSVQRLGANLVDEIDAEIVAMHRRDGTAPLGRRAVLAVNPHAMPEGEAECLASPAVRFHAATAEVRSALLEAYRTFVAAYRAAAARLRQGDRSVTFPENSFPPTLPFVEPGLVFR